MEVLFGLWESSRRLAVCLCCWEFKVFLSWNSLYTYSQKKHKNPPSATQNLSVQTWHWSLNSLTQMFTIATPMPPFKRFEWSLFWWHLVKGTCEPWVCRWVDCGWWPWGKCRSWLRHSTSGKIQIKKAPLLTMAIRLVFLATWGFWFWIAATVAVAAECTALGNYFLGWKFINGFVRPGLTMLIT